MPESRVLVCSLTWRATSLPSKSCPPPSGLRAQRIHANLSQAFDKALRHGRSPPGSGVTDPGVAESSTNFKKRGRIASGKISEILFVPLIVIHHIRPSNLHPLLSYRVPAVSWEASPAPAQRNNVHARLSQTLNPAPWEVGGEGSSSSLIHGRIQHQFRRRD